MQVSKDANILILSHFYKRTTTGGGPPQEIRDFFKPKVKRIYYIEHPFPKADDRRSSLAIYEKGVLKKQIFAPPLFGPQALFYIIDIFITWYFVITVGKKFDLCVALDNLNTVSMLPFKNIGVVKKLAFYTIDYTPLRFKNEILNNMYHFFDRLACYHTDVIWNLSGRMKDARKKNGVDMKKSAPSVLLPMGANLARIKILPIEKIHRFDIIFVGYLLEKQGVQLVLKSLKNVITKVPRTRFIIIGQGEYESKLKELTKSLDLEQYVTFKGFIKNYTDVENITRKAAIAIAPYPPVADNFSFYADPGKVKLYLGCGLPIVITDVPAIARVIKRKKAGIVTSYTTEGITKALILLLTNDTIYKEYRNNAIELSKDYDTNSLISKALEQTN